LRFDRDEDAPRELDALDRFEEEPDDRRDVDEARPPIRPPLRDEAVLIVFPRPEPLFLPPPVSLLTVAQARRSASSLEVPRSSYPSSMCSAIRFCLSV